MERRDSSSRNGSTQTARVGSPHRLPSKSYPPRTQSRREHGASVDVKLTDLMDEDEARWMSTMESSRAPTPIQGASSPSAAKVNSRPVTPSLANEKTCNSRNETPPLPPLSEHRQSPSSRQTHSHETSESSTGLTALPQRPQSRTNPTFAQRVFLAAKSDLLYNYVERHRLPWRFKTLRHGAVDITTLQKMQKYVIQQKLVAQIRVLGERECWADIGIGETVREYCQIIQDLEYMEKHAMRGNAHDPFLITTRRPLEAQLLEEAGLARRSPGSKSARHTIPSSIQHLSRRSPCLELLRRLSIMFAMALAVLLPFLVSVFTSAYLARIIVVCACAAGFAVVSAAISGKSGRLSPAVALTLVYVAGLIIFLGTTPSRYAG